MKDRILPCKFYEAECSCTKGHEGTFKKYCQRCKDYKHISPYKHNTDNLKKRAEDKLSRKIEVE